MTTSTKAYPTAGEFIRTMVLFRLGIAFKRALDDPNFTPRGRLTGQRADWDSVLMEEPELQMIDKLGPNHNLHGRTGSRAAAELQEVIRGVLDESGDTAQLTEFGVKVIVVARSRQGYSGNLWAVFAPLGD
jgi:hypothetical protein